MGNRGRKVGGRDGLARSLLWMPLAAKRLATFVRAPQVACLGLPRVTRMRRDRGVVKWPSRRHPPAAPVAAKTRESRQDAAPPRDTRLARAGGAVMVQCVVVNLRIDSDETRRLGAELHVCELQLVLRHALVPSPTPPLCPCRGWHRARPRYGRCVLPRGRRRARHCVLPRERARGGACVPRTGRRAAGRAFYGLGFRAETGISCAENFVDARCYWT